MKKSLWILLMTGVLFLTACTNDEQTPSVPTETESPCKLTPLAEGCYIPSDDLDFISVTPDEYLITETFDDERVDATPRNWLLYRDQEYAVNGVIARITEQTENNNYVRLYSDGAKAPMFPQNAPTPTFIFTNKFNLDIDQKGVAYISLMMPSEQMLENVTGTADQTHNAISVGLSTGSVNTMSVNVRKDLSVQIKIGGPYFYYSGTGDGGDTYDTDLTLSLDTWYTFKYTWDVALNTLSIHLVGETDVLLYTGSFHISSRFNAESSGVIIPPNVVRITMPRFNQGWAFIDEIIVERKGA